MAWVDPVTIAFAEMVDEDRYNQEVVDNPQFLYDNGYAIRRIIPIGYQEVANTTDETTVISETVPGGLLGVNGLIRVEFHMLNFNNSGTNRTTTVRVKLGATTVMTDSISVLTHAARYRSPWRQVLITNQGAVDAQIVSYVGMVNEGNNETAGTAFIVASSSNQGFQYATEDTSADKMIAVTVQHGAAHATYWSRVQGFVMLLNKGA